MGLVGIRGWLARFATSRRGCATLPLLVMHREDKRAYVVMGVSGSGKTTVGERLAERLGWSFLDADDFHPEANVEKMSRGESLNDSDRAPWLARLREVIGAHLEDGEPLILACSALKERYRERLRVDRRVGFIYLEGSFELIQARMNEREGHFMKTEMLESQFEALEEPDPGDALSVDISQSIDEVVKSLEAQLT